MEFTTMSKLIEQAIVLLNDYLETANYDYEDKLDCIADFLNGNKNQELENAFFLNISYQLEKINDDGLDKNTICNMAILSMSAMCYTKLFYYKINDMTLNDFPYEVLDFLESVESYKTVLTEFYNNRDMAKAIIHEYLRKIEENNYYTRYIEETVMNAGKLPNILKIDPFQIVEYAELLELDYDEEIKTIIRVMSVFKKELSSFTRKVLYECDNRNFIEQIINENIFGYVSDNDFEYEMVANEDLEDYMEDSTGETENYDEDYQYVDDLDDCEEVAEIQRQAEEECDRAEIVITNGIPNIFYKIAQRESLNDKTICYFLKGAYSQLLLESKDFSEAEIKIIENESISDLINLFRNDKEFATEMMQKYIVYYCGSSEVIPEQFPHKEAEKVYEKLKIN